MKARLLWGAGGLLALLLVVLGAVGVYLMRAQPQHEGTLRLQGLKSTVKVSRDGAGVVHIQGESMADAAFALGFTHAQERGWQLEFNRRIMHGELAEILGEAALPVDKLLRTLGIYQAAQNQFASYPDDVKATLQAYSKGIQAFYASGNQTLSPEFLLLGTKPGGRSGVAWEPADSVGWALMMALDLGGNWGQEISRLSVAKVLDTPRLWDLYSGYPGEPPATKVDLAKFYKDLGVYSTSSSNDAAASRGSAAFKQTASLSLPFLGEPGLVEGKGSNNWVISGERTASGKPLLANDPHLGLGTPAIWFYAHLQSPDQNVIGATLPGMPLVVLGHNSQVAWGFTNTGPDVQDLYLEKINPANPLQYQTPEGWQAFETRQESIRVKGMADVSYTVRSTRHGPVLSDAQSAHADIIDTSKFVLALRWSALDVDNRTLVAGMRGSQAGNVSEFLEAFKDYHSPMQNVVVADVQGHIAYKAIGKVPVRHPENDLMGMAPAPGWDAKYDWTGWLPLEQTPQDLGERGWIATANQRITPEGYPHFLGQDWVAPHRMERITTLINDKPKHDMDSMKAMQNDVLSLSTQRLLPYLQAAQSSHPLASAAQKALHGFNGEMKAESAAPLVFAYWADELTRGLVEPKLGKTLFEAQYGKRHFRIFLEATMAKQDAGWCAPKTCAEQSNEAFTRALVRLSKDQGKDVANWNWGKAHMAISGHRPLGKSALLAKWFDVIEPSSGDPFTVNVGTYWLNETVEPFASRHAPSMRAIYDLSDLQNSLFIYQTGQSGVIGSSHYSDMAHEWANGEYRPLQMTPNSQSSLLTLKP
jgi:penicillin G amidase